MITLQIPFRTTQVITLGTVSNNVNLYTSAGSPTDARNVLFFNTANTNATNSTSYAMRLGATWKGGSTVYLRNTATITGANGVTGASGAGGAGGAGGSYTYAQAPSGSAGGTGGNGGSGNTALFADTNSNVVFLIDNTSGTITGGSGGTGGQGGGGGGGGGQAINQ